MVPSRFGVFLDVGGSLRCLAVVGGLGGVHAVFVHGHCEARGQELSSNPCQALVLGDHGDQCRRVAGLPFGL